MRANMQSDKVRQQIIRLCGNIRLHNHNYFALDNPQITDAQYDQLLQKTG